jgi:plasmid stability protein
MALIQVRDVPESTVDVLKARAAARGMSLTAYLREELNTLAARPTNAEVLARMMSRDRTGGPTTAETVALIRSVRDSS